MRHVEFFDAEHFKKNYHRIQPAEGLGNFIDFFWQTRFEELLEKYPAGFSDALFPNTGYSFLLNLGTPFEMVVGDKRFSICKDSFLPRHNNIECFHSQGNELFGIKFRLSPILLEKKINFSEYQKSMMPLSYLIDKHVVVDIKQPVSFEQRVERLNSYFLKMIRQNQSIDPVRIVSEILTQCDNTKMFNYPVDKFAIENGISTRTLQRYFELATGVSCKKSLQLLRIRRSVEYLVSNHSFDPGQFGYFDYSHFYKHLQIFMGREQSSALVKKVRRLSSS